MSDCGIMGFSRLTDLERAALAEQIACNSPGSFPVSIELQPTNKCNINCFFCSSLSTRGMQEELPWKTLETLLCSGSEKGLKSVRLSGGGESLVYSHIRPLLELMTRSRIRLSHVTTNGTSLFSLAALLTQVGVDAVEVSLNEPVPSLYRDNMGTREDLFHRIIEGMEELARLRDSAVAADRMEIHLKLMLHRGNYRLLPQMLDLARRLGVDRLLLNSICMLPTEHRMNEQELKEAEVLLRQVIQEDMQTQNPVMRFNLFEEGLLQRAALETSGVLLEKEACGTANRTRFCMVGWYHAAIAANGLVFPCCNFVGRQAKVMGDLRLNSMEKIWKGPSFTAYRTEFREVALMKGNVEFSRRFYKYLEPGCIPEYGCPFTWALFDQLFYNDVAHRTNQTSTTSERLRALGRRSFLKIAHSLRRR